MIPTTPFETVEFICRLVEINLFAAPAESVLYLKTLKEELRLRQIGGSRPAPPSTISPPAPAKEKKTGETYLGGAPRMEFHPHQLRLPTGNIPPK